MQNPGKELSPIIVLSDALWFPAGSRNEKEPRAKPANHCECSVFSGSVFRKGGFQAQGVSVLNTENRTLRTHEIRPLREIRFLKILQRLVGHAQYGQDLNIHHRPHAPLDPAHHQRVAIPTRPLQPPTHLGLRNPELLPKLANASSHCFPCWPVVRRRSGKVVTVKGMSFRSSTTKNEWSRFRCVVKWSWLFCDHAETGPMLPRMYDRLLRAHFQENRQMAFLAGPRQVGKTAVARQMADGCSSR